MTNIINAPKTQTLNAVITFAGVKGDFSKLAAAADIRRAALHNIIDGNSRPFDDTRAAIPKGLVIDKEASQHSIGLVKTGNVKAYKYANNQQGIILAAVIGAARTSRLMYEALHLNGVNSKNAPKYDKKLTAEDKAAAEVHADNIASEFLTFCEKAAAALTVSKNAAADKAKTTKTTNAAAIEKAAAEEAKAAEVLAKKAAADTVTLSELLKNIKGGNAEALAMALLISNALQAFNDNKAAKAAAAAEKAKAKAAAIISDKKRHANNKAINAEVLAAAA